MATQVLNDASARVEWDKAATPCAAWLAAEGPPQSTSASREARLAEIVNDLAQRQKRGESLDAELLAGEFPDLDSEIRTLLPVLGLMCDLPLVASDSLGVAGGERS